MTTRSFPTSQLVIKWRHAVVALCVTMCILAGFSATHLHKDTSADAFIDPDSQALAYRRQVADHFGLKDPIVIAITNNESTGVLNAQSLFLVRQLTEQISELPNIDPERVTSLATKNAIRGGTDGLEIDALLREGEIDADAIERLSQSLAEMPVYEGVLISRDRTTTMIAAELLDHREADATYSKVTELVQHAARNTPNQVYVAGEGAVAGYLSTYIDHDAQRLVPLAMGVIALVLFCAFFTLRGALLSMAVAVATVVCTLGVMAAFDAPYSSISNGMVVSLIGMSVADAIHVFSEYYTAQEDHPEFDNQQLVAASVNWVWRPMLLTSITTVGGFIALWATSDLTPIRQFGLYGALGMGAAWIFTVTLLPALMTYLPKKPSPLLSRVVKGKRLARREPIGAGIVRLGEWVLKHPRVITLVAVAVFACGAILATRIQVDFARVDNFDAHAPIRVADTAINNSMGGTYHLDVVIEVPEGLDVMQPAVLHKIERLQAYLRSLPHVGASVSIADIIKSLNRAAEDGNANAYRVPDDANLIAQLLVSYQASVSPTELQSLIDGTQREALVRTYLNTKLWSEQNLVVKEAQQYIQREFTGVDVKATLTGRVVVDDELIESIKSGHWRSLFLSTLTVLLSAIIVLRSVRDGFLCSVPVLFSIVVVYATMGAANIWLTVATSMFASIAIGLGMDFGIHIVSREREAAKLSTDVVANVLSAYRATGRAAVFNAAAVCFGFGLVATSQVPPIRMFGVLVAVAIGSTFFASLTILPVLLKWLGVREQRRHSKRPMQDAAPVLSAPITAKPMSARDIALMVLFGAALVASAVSISLPARAAEPATIDSNDDASRLMELLANRSDGETSDRTVHIKLIDRSGGVREQVTRAVRKDFAGERRSAIFYLQPATVRGTAFLVYDYASNEKSDDQWLYLPAMRKTRRIPASQRGDYFLGTDLTYDEIRNDNRVTLSDWRFKSAGEDQVGGYRCTLIDGTAANEQVTRELGYGRARWCIDRESQIARRIEYWDRNGNVLKTVINSDIAKMGAVWTAQRIEVTNQKTGHRTVLELKDSRFDSALPDSLFSQAQLERGL